jgi:hypothetical protein
MSAKEKPGARPGSSVRALGAGSRSLQGIENAEMSLVAVIKVRKVFRGI